MGDRELRQSGLPLKAETKRSKEILPRVSAINRPTTDRSLQRRSNSIRKETLPMGVRSETVQIEEVHHQLTVNVGESPKYHSGKSSSYLQLGREHQRNSSFSKSTVKYAGQQQLSKEYLEKFDQVVEELASLELENRRISAENVVLREELGLMRNTRSRTVADSQDYLRRVREAEESTRSMRDILADKEQECRLLHQKVASMDALQHSYGVYRGFVLEVTRLFSNSQQLSVEQLLRRIQQLLRESRSFGVQLQQLEGNLREKQHIGNEELQTVIQKYNEAVFQKNEVQLKLFDLKEEKVTLANQLEQLNSRLAAQTDQIAIKDRDQLVVRMENQDLRSELEGFRREYGSLQRRIQQLEKEKEGVMRDRTTSERQLFEKLKQAQDARVLFAAEFEQKHLHSLNTVAAERDRIRRQLEQTREELVRGNVEKEHLHGNLLRLQSSLEEIYANRDELARSKTQLETSLRQSTGQFSQLQTEQRIRLQTTISQTQQQIAELTRQNGDLHSQIDRSSHRNAQLQRDLQQLRREQSQRTAGLDRLRFENGQLAMDVQETRRQLRSKECELQSLGKSLTYQIDSIDRARRLVQQEYDRERAERIEVEGRLRQSQLHLLETSTKAFGAEKYSLEATRLQETLRNELDVRQKLQGMFEANRLELYSLKETLKMRESDWQRERVRLFDDIRTQQAEVDSLAGRLNRQQGESDSKLLIYEEKLSHMTFELQSARNEILNRSNEYDAETHKLRLALEHGQAEYNSLNIIIDRLQQQLRQAEEEAVAARRQSNTHLQRYERDNQKLREQQQYQVSHYQSLIKEIRQASASEEAVRVKAELAEKLSAQYEQRLASVRSDLLQQETQKLAGLRAEYQQKIRDLQREKLQLSSKVDSYQKQISQLSHQTNSSSNQQSLQIMQLQQRFKEVNQGLSHTQKFYQSRIDQLTQDISRRSKEYEQKLDEVKRQEEDKHARLMERFKESDTRSYNGELSRITEEYQLLAKRQYRQYQESAAQLKNSLELKISEVSTELQGKVSLYEQRIRELERLKIELEEKVLRLQSEHQLRCGAYEHNIRQLQDELKRKDDDFNRQRHEDTRYEDSASLLMTDLQAKLSRIEVRARQLEGQLASEKRAAELAATSQVELQRKNGAMIDSLRKEVADTNSQLTEFKFKSMFMEGQIDRLKRELDSSRDKYLAETSVQSRRKIEPDFSKLQEKNRIIVEQRQEIQNLLHRYDKLRIEMSSRQDKHFQQVRALKDVSFGLQKETIEVNSKLQLAHIKIEELKVENRQVREELRILQQHHQSLKRSMVGGSVATMSRQIISQPAQLIPIPQQQSTAQPSHQQSTPSIPPQQTQPPVQSSQPQPIPQGFPKFDLYQGARSTESMALEMSRRIISEATGGLKGSSVTNPNQPATLPLRSGLMSPQYSQPQSPNSTSPFFKQVTNPPSTTTTIQSSAANYQAASYQPTEDYRAVRTTSKALTIQNIIKIDNPEGRNDSRQRIIQLGGKRNEVGGGTRQSSKSPNERKITITYDTTKRTLNNSNSSQTGQKPSTAGRPIEVTTKIIQPVSSQRGGILSSVSEDRNKSGSRERPRMMQVVSSSNSHNQPFLKFQSPPPRIESSTAKPPTSPQIIVNSRQADEPKNVMRIRLGSDISSSDKPPYEPSSLFGENKISLATNENSHPNLITRVNSSHTLGSTAGIHVASRHPTIVGTSEQYQSTLVGNERKITEMKRVQSSSNTIMQLNLARHQQGTPFSKAEESEAEEQGIRVFQINELQKKPCC